ncbi:MAG: hypothetical protein Q8L34_05925 [Candidatus Woesearchaeota archaeon]|nr:hypothetical protein [Candidatus Woesearchaeota archaeon]
MGARQFDYYIFIDYSEDLIGYIIISQNNVKEILPKITKFRHYRKVGDKRLYIKNIKLTFKRENLLQYFIQHKVRETKQNMEIFLDIGEFIKIHPNCLIFASVDDNQYRNFQSFVKIVDGKNIRVMQESELKIGTVEYQINLVLDNWLNIERLRNV